MNNIDKETQTNFEKFFKSLNIETISDFLSHINSIDTAPWTLWFDKNYCSKCPAIECYCEYFHRNVSCAYCELEHKCKFFDELSEVPNIKEIIKLWLQAEAE